MLCGMIKSKKLFLNYGGLFDYISYSSKDIKLTFQIRAHGAYLLQWEKLPCDVRIFFLKFFIRRNLIAQPYIVGFPLGFPIGISSSSQVVTFQLFKTVFKIHLRNPSVLVGIFLQAKYIQIHRAGHLETFSRRFVYTVSFIR